MSYLREAREQLGMTQSDFADALDVSQGMVSEWESGASTPRPWRWRQMSSVLRVSLAKLANALTGGGR